jgi:hypothetical protein
LELAVCQISEPILLYMVLDHELCTGGIRYPTEGHQTTSDRSSAISALRNVMMFHFQRLVDATKAASVLNTSVSSLLTRN